ncbi:MAG TPA: helix-hairpin-helix domain-containing protein, partial [Terriglobia bacterium]|nr:helix-hairpin-helix domain-containing protein [Terriglobia bacterium]
MENREIAAVFEEIASIMRVTQDDPKWSFKASAYDRAKRSIESYPERLEDLARDPARKLTEIPGVGADIAAKIKELLDTGRLQYHQDQLQKIPRTLLDIMQVQGIGPQKARLFYQQLDIKTLDDLAAAARHGRLRELPGMSEKSEQNILKALSVFQAAAGRFRLDTAYDTAEEIRAFLAETIP